MSRNRPSRSNGNVLVLPNEGFFINSLPHVAQFAEPDVAERYVASGAFRYGSADEAETEPLEPQEVPPHFAAPAEDPTESDEPSPAPPEPSQDDSPPPAE